MLKNPNPFYIGIYNDYEPIKIDSYELERVEHLCPISRESDTCRTILENKRESDDVITSLVFEI